MNASDIKEGMYVYSYYYSYGKVNDIIDDEFVNVLWDCDTDHAYIDQVEIAELELFDLEAHKEMLKVAQKRIDQAVSEFETAFQTVIELRNICHMSTEGLLAEVPGLDLSKLENVLTSNGWNHSSIYC